MLDRITRSQANHAGLYANSRNKRKLHTITLRTLEKKRDSNLRLDLAICTLFIFIPLSCSFTLSQFFPISICNMYVYVYKLYVALAVGSK